jgi:hypothetical protein
MHKIKMIIFYSSKLKGDSNNRSYPVHFRSFHLHLPADKADTKTGQPDQQKTPQASKP